MAEVVGSCGLGIAGSGFSYWVGGEGKGLLLTQQVGARVGRLIKHCKHWEVNHKAVGKPVNSTLLRNTTPVLLRVCRISFSISYVVRTHHRHAAECRVQN